MKLHKKIKFNLVISKCVTPGKIKDHYYMAKPVLGKSLCSDWFFLGQDFAVRTVSMETVQPVYFCFERSRQIQNLQPKQRKKKLCILSFFTVKLPEEAKKIEIFPKFQILNCPE